MFADWLKLNAIESIHPIITDTQVLSSTFANGSKLKAKELVQPKTIGVQTSGIFANKL